MGLIQKRGSKRETTPRRVRTERREVDELDQLIEYGQTTLTAPGTAPLAMQLDTALRVAGLYVRRAGGSGATKDDDVNWAVRLATLVAHRCEETPPAAVVELASRAVAILELSAQQLSELERGPAQELARRTRERVGRAEQLVALSLDSAISALVVAQALLRHAPDGDDREVVLDRARTLLTTAVIAARRAGNEDVASAALALIDQFGPPNGYEQSSAARNAPRLSRMTDM